MMKKEQTKGFTLIELLIVIVIISILAALLLAAIFNVQKWSDRMTTQNTLKLVRNALTDYKAGTGTFPLMDWTSTVGGPDAAKAGTWAYTLQTAGPDAPYIKDSSDVMELDAANDTAEVYDAWGMPIRFRVIGKVSGSNSGISTSDYYRIGNLLGAFYVWSMGPNQIDEFESEYDNVSSNGGWDADLSDQQTWQTFEQEDDSIWEEEAGDDVVISGLIKR